MTGGLERGLVLRCPVCGAEIAVLALGGGSLRCRCCNIDMVATSQRLLFYRCGVCGAEIALVRKGDGAFVPVCCNQPMQAEHEAA